MKAKLTTSRIGRLRPKSGEYTVWDSITPHLGVRVTPTGTMRFIHTAQVDGKLKKTTIGDAGLMPLDEARTIARDLDAGGGKAQDRKPCPTLREWVDVWWSRTSTDIKPATRKGYRFMLDRKLLPAFGGKPLDGIDRAGILAWYERYSRTSPGSANYALELLSSILKYAVRMEVIPSNPASRIQRNPKGRKTRFLSDEERKRLLAEIDYVPQQHRIKALTVKMLLFTGCRSGEIRSLKWEEVENDALQLQDSKVGPRKVWLNNEARAIIDEAKARQEGSARSEYVFPHPKDAKTCLGDRGFFAFWKKLRERAGIPDVRIHDLRHSFASEAVRRGIPLPVVSKLLGHSNIAMTMRYAHVSNSVVEDAVERVGDQLVEQINGS